MAAGGRFPSRSQPILLAAALALLTTHVLYAPIERLVSRLLPKFSTQTRQQIAGISGTTAA